MGVEVGICCSVPLQMTRKSLPPQGSALEPLAEEDTEPVVAANKPLSARNVCGQGGGDNAAYYPEKGSYNNLDNDCKKCPDDNDDVTIAESPRGGSRGCREANVDNVVAPGASLWRNGLRSGEDPLKVPRRDCINNGVSEGNIDGVGGSNVLQGGPKLQESGGTTSRPNPVRNHLDHDAPQVNATPVAVGDTSTRMMEGNEITFEEYSVASNTSSVVAVAVSHSAYHAQGSDRRGDEVDATIGLVQELSCDANLVRNEEKQQENAEDERLPVFASDASENRNSSVVVQRGLLANPTLQADEVEVDGREEAGEIGNEDIPACRLVTGVVLPTAPSDGVVKMSEIVGPTSLSPDSTRSEAPPVVNSEDHSDSSSSYDVESEVSTVTSSITSSIIPVPAGVPVAKTTPSSREYVQTIPTEASGSTIFRLNERDGNAIGRCTTPDGAGDEGATTTHITTAQEEGIIAGPGERGNDEARAGDMGEVAVKQQEREKNHDDASSNEPKTSDNELEYGSNMVMGGKVVLVVSPTSKACEHVGGLCDSTGGSTGNRETTATMAIILPSPSLETTGADTALSNDAVGDAGLIESTASTVNPTHGDGGDGTHLPTPFVNNPPQILAAAAMVETTETGREGSDEGAEGGPAVTTPTSLTSGSPGPKTGLEVEHNDAGCKGGDLSLQEVVLTPRPPSPVSVTEHPASGGAPFDSDAVVAVAVFAESPTVTGDDAMSTRTGGDLQLPPTPTVKKYLPPKIVTASTVVEEPVKGDVRGARGGGGRGGGLVGRMHSFGSPWGRNKTGASSSQAPEDKCHARGRDSNTGSVDGDIRDRGLRSRLRSFGAGKNKKRGATSKQEADSDRGSSANSSGTVSPAASSPGAATAVFSPRGNMQRVASWASSTSSRGEIDGVGGGGDRKTRAGSFRLSLRKQTAKISPKSRTSSARITSPSGRTLGAGIRTASFAASPESSPLAASNNGSPQGGSRRGPSWAGSISAGGDVKLEEGDTSYRCRQDATATVPSEKAGTAIRIGELKYEQEEEPCQHVGSLAVVPPAARNPPAGDVDSKDSDGIHADHKEEPQQQQGGAPVRQHRRGRSSGLLSALRSRGSKKNGGLRSESPPSRGRKDDKGAK